MMSSIGLDVGVSDFLACSNGVIYDSLTDTLKPLVKRKKKIQRAMARQIKWSNNWKNNVRKLQRIEKKMSDVRFNRNHQVSTELVNRYNIIFIENLQICNMTSSAKGTKENPGKNVKQKSGLNRAILQEGWGDFFRMLQYKLEAIGGELIEVPPAYTSQTCSRCGHCEKDNRRGKQFKCVSCDFEADADVNAAKNILKKGLISKKTCTNI